MNADGFWARVDKRQDGCWLWTGGRMGREHDRGIVKWHGQPTVAYRVSLELAGVTIPPGYDVHHACGRPLCVRPDHLRLLTPAEHAREHHASHCKYGHPMSGENLGVIRTGKNVGMRYCRTCNRLSARKRKGMPRNIVLTAEVRAAAEALVSAGITNKAEIGRRLGISQRSVTRVLDPNHVLHVPGLHRPDGPACSRR